MKDYAHMHAAARIRSQMYGKRNHSPGLEKNVLKMIFLLNFFS